VTAHAFQPAPSSAPERFHLPIRESYRVDDIVLRHLKTDAEIDSVLHLREEIDLSIHAASGQGFTALEKKETSVASSLHLT
jgi:hypothetical protein